MYADWERDKPHAIRWETYNNAANALVRIDLYRDTTDGPALLQTISAGAADTGSFVWTPSANGINYGTYGLRIQVSLVGNPTVLDRSQEPFAVPESGHAFYVNDGSTVNDQYATAAGSNRNTGRVASGPKPNVNNLVRLYGLGAGDTLFVDNGAYRTFDPVVLSGTVGVGDDEGFALTGPSNPGRTAAIQFANPITVAPLLDLNAADFMTVSNLTLTGGQYGLYAHNQSTHLTARNVTANANSLDGLRVEGGSDGAALEGITAIGNLRFGIYVNGPLDHLTGSTVSLNHSTGIDLEQPGAARVENNTVASNLGIGIYAFNYGNPAQAVIGNADLCRAKATS